MINTTKYLTREENDTILSQRLTIENASENIILTRENCKILYPNLVEDDTSKNKRLGREDNTVL